MSDVLLNNINDADIEYTIIVKRMDDILFEVTDDTNERYIYESIIDGIEKYASDNIKDGKIAQLPSIGCVRKNPIRQVVRDNHNNFRLARKSMNASQYKDHVREVIIDAKQIQAKLERDKLILKRIRSKNKKRYDKLYITLGKAYAEMYIQSILYLREVPFDKEVQDHLDSFNNK